MENSFHQQESDIRHPRGFFISRKIFDRILHWLADTFQLTEKEKREAGIYLGEQYSRKY
jgi:hypothetical protein